MKRFVYALFLVQIICSCVLPANAKMLGFYTAPISEDDVTAYIEKMQIHNVEDDNYKGNIQSFDVNENGIYALALSSGSGCRVHVYNPDHEFLYGFTFNVDGAYGIAFHEDSLAVFFIRGNVVLAFDQEGNCIKARKVLNSRQNNAYAREFLDRTEKTVNGKYYALERDIEIGNTYSRFVVIKNENKTILYDNSSNHTSGGILSIVLGLSFFAFVAWGAIKKRLRD